jgi:NADH:ubiquinone oxidoreductase subunit 2 (subunit N)
MPPLAGFMSKWQIFVAGFQSHEGLIIALMIFAALNSVLSLGYYAPLVNILYRKQPGEAVRNGAPIPVLMLIPLWVLLLAVVVLGFYPSLLADLTRAAGQAIFGF